MSQSLALPILMAIPLVASVVVFSLKDKHANLAKWIGLLVALAVVVYALVLGIGFDTKPGAARFQFVGSWWWIKALRGAPRLRRGRHRAWC